MENMNENIKNLITRLLAGEATNREKTELDQWLGERKENIELFEEFKKTWLLEPLKENKIIIDRPMAWEKITQMIEQEEAIAEPKVIPLHKNRMRLFYAVSAIAAMILLFWGIYVFLPKSTEAPMISFNHTGLHETVDFTLPDGTIVYFNGEASLRFPEHFTGNERQVELTGNAFFEVARMDNKPFIITLNGGAIEVMGTSFDIRQQTENITVSLVTGKIAFIPFNGDRIIVEKNQKVIHNLTSGLTHIEEIADQNFLAWKTKRLVFTEAGLDKVFEDLMLAYHIRIEWPEEVSDKKLTARFENDKPETIMASIELLFGVSIKKINGIYKVNL